MDRSLLSAPLIEIREKVIKREITAEELVRHHYQCSLEKTHLNAWIQLNEKAIEQAVELDKRIARGESVGRLAGLPIGLKDLFCVEGQKTTAGSKMLKDFVSPYTSTVAEKLLAEDAILLGKCNLDEFAMGSSNETSYFGPCKNPWDERYVSGGSSGGSAVSVASGQTLASIGTDTGGSIRQPAQFCGIVGFKPSYGRVSRFGIVAYASSLDQSGPMTRSVKDAALLGDIISGFDGRDSTCAQTEPMKTFSHLHSAVKGLKVGVMKQIEELEISPETQRTMTRTMSLLRQLGVEIREVSVPLVKEAVSIYYLIAMSEASTNLSRYDGVRFGHRASFANNPARDLEEFYSRNRSEGFGEEVKRRILLGTYCLSAGYYDEYFYRACRARRLLSQQMTEAFCHVDVLLSPVSNGSAFLMNSKINNPLEMYNNDILTAPVNLVGLPAISLPTELNDQKLPLGVQLIGSYWGEQNILNLALALEEQLQFSQEYRHVT